MNILYSHFFEKLLSKEIGWLTDDVKCALCDSSYIPDRENHVYKSDLTGIVLEIPLNNRVINHDSDTHKTSLRADDIKLENVTLKDILSIVIYVDKGESELSPLIGYIDLNVPRNITNGIFSIVWDSEGIFTYTQV